MTFTETFTVQALAPFNFDLTAQIFGSGDKQIRIYEDGRFLQVIRIGGKLALLALESAGIVKLPRLRAELKARQEINHADTEEAAKIVTRLFNLDLDLLPFYAIAKNDETLFEITQRLRGTTQPHDANHLRSPDGFNCGAANQPKSRHYHRETHD